MNEMYDTAIARDPVQTSPLSEKLGDLNDHVERLDYMIGRLIERLDLVLRPSTPVNITAEGALAQVRSDSQLLDRLNMIDGKINAAADRINLLADRLDT